MQNLMIGFACLVVIFFLVILLGLQIQISTLTRRIDDLVSAMKEKDDRES